VAGTCHWLAFFANLHLGSFVRALGADDLSLGGLVAAASLVVLLLRPLFGRALDGAGARTVAIVGGALHVAVWCLFLTVHAFGAWLVVVRIAEGASEALVLTALIAYVGDTSPEHRRVQALAVFGACAVLPIGISAWAGDVILARMGFSRLFEGAALLSLVGLAASLLLPRAEPVPRTGDLTGFFHVVLSRRALAILLVALSITVATNAYYVFLRTEVPRVAPFFLSYTAASLLSRFTIGAAPDRVGPFRVLYPTLALLFLGLCTLALGTSRLPIAGMLCGAGDAVALPILLALSRAQVPEERRGAVTSAFFGLFDVGRLVGAPLLGLVVRAAGHRAMFATAAAVVLCGVLALPRLERQLDR
jgi:MFS family permease